VVQIEGSPNLKAEQLRDFELGYRDQVGKRLSLDLSVFRSYYRRLETSEYGTPFLVATPGPPHQILPLILGDDAHARTYGGEVSATWNVMNRWRITPGLGLIHMNTFPDPSSPDARPAASAGDTPKHQFQLRSSFSPRRNLDWDTSLYFVGQVRTGNIPSDTRLDTRLGWRITEQIELSIAGQNLLRPRHAESGDAYGLDHTLVERSVVGKITWRF
jgi:iron complex outermembrane recepter protein